jgi:hypothetical protein
MPSTPASDVNRMAPAAGDVPPSLSSESELDLYLTRNADAPINVRDNDAWNTSPIEVQRPVAAPLHVVGGVDTIDRDDQHSTATSSDAGTVGGFSTWAPPAPTAPGKIAAAARARALAGQAAEPRVAAISTSTSRLPPIEPVADMPEDRYVNAGNARLSIPLSLADTAPPLYSERPTS